MSRWPEQPAEDVVWEPARIQDDSAEVGGNDTIAAGDIATSTVPNELKAPEVLDVPESPDLPQSRVRRPRRSARGAILVGARVVAGTIGVCVAVATVAAASLLPLPEYRVTAPTVEVVPAAAAAQRICPGPLLRLGGSLGQDAATASPTGSAVVQASTDSGSAQATSLTGADQVGDAPALVVAASGSGAGSHLAGSQSQAVQGGDFGGFAAAECALAGSDSWFVGGATDTGRTTLITLANPTTISSTVSISVFSESGAITAPGSDGIVVPPGGQRVLPLAGLAPGILSPVVRVQSRGGQIVANLQQAIARTLEPGGVTIIGASPAPAKHTVIPGVVLAGGDEVAARRASPGFEDLAAIIRLFAPGDAAVHSRITLQPEGDAKPAVPVEVTLAGGQVTDVPLDDFADGSYTVTIDADGPVAAGARVSTVGANAVDVAWFAAAAPVRSGAQLSIAGGPGPVLHLANSTKADATVQLVRVGGEPQEFTVPAGRALAVPISAKADYSLSGFDTLRIAVSYRGDGQIDGFAVSPPAAAADPIRVHP